MERKAYYSIVSSVRFSRNEENRRLIAREQEMEY